MIRTEILQSIINHIKATSYLEIGIGKSRNFKKIVCDYKTGVDPNVRGSGIITKTSDDFFLECKNTYDVIFIDGLHLADQVERDITNSLIVLNKNGYIVCHDMLPSKKADQNIPAKNKLWNGDCWKAWVRIRGYRPDLNMRVVDADFGCGIITRGDQDVINIDNKSLNWNNFVNNKQSWMNIISLEQFYLELSCSNSQ